MLDWITVNKQSSIRIAGSRILYFDPLEIPAEPHDADMIFITHEHYDHFSPTDIGKLRKPGTRIFAPESMKDKLTEMLPGAGETEITFVTPGDCVETDGISVSAVPAYNVGKPFHTKERGWVGYLVVMDGTTYYVMGDTDENPDNRKIRCDVLLIPIGGTYTMDTLNAATYIHLIRPKYVVPTHYGSIVGTPGDGEILKTLVDPEIPIVRKLG